MAFLISPPNKLPVLSYILTFLIALSAVYMPASVLAQETTYERPLPDTNENAEKLILELKEVTERYPILSQRFGLVQITGYRIPMLCVGGVNETLHGQLQAFCIKDAISRGEEKKDYYNRCLDFANTGSCRPAVFTTED